VTFLIIFLAISCFSANQTDSLEQEDKKNSLLVLGSKNKGESRFRVECAVKLLEEIDVSKVVFAGRGKGISFNGKVIPESEYMFEHFKSICPLDTYKGISCKTEIRSMNTFDNIKFSIKYFKRAENIIIVSTHSRKRLAIAVRQLKKWLVSSGDVSYFYCNKVEVK
jgi:hypothetical protein